MSNSNTGLSKLDTRSIGEHEAAESSISIAEAEAAAAILGLGAEATTKVMAHSQYGKFVAAKGMSSFVASNCVWSGDILNKAMDFLSGKLVDGTDIESAVAIVSALKDVALAKNALLLTALKSTEIIAHGQKKKSHKTHAPNMIITGDRTQVLVQSNGVEKAGGQR